MFEVGFTEIVLIFGIALLVLGPARLPKLAADLGRWAGRARAMARQLRTQLEQEVRLDPLQDDYSKPSSTAPTIHSPAPPVDAQARATPAQVAAATPAPGLAALTPASGSPVTTTATGHVAMDHTNPDTPATTQSVVSEPPPYPEALLRPDKTMPDEPKPV